MQACKHKHRKLHEHALHFFAPEALRDAAPASRPAAEDAAYAKLEGLGKIPFSNIRRPRPLMDLMDKQPAEKSKVRFPHCIPELRLAQEVPPQATVCQPPCHLRGFLGMGWWRLLLLPGVATVASLPGLS